MLAAELLVVPAWRTLAAAEPPQLRVHTEAGLHLAVMVRRQKLSEHASRSPSCALDKGIRLHLQGLRRHAATSQKSEGSCRKEIRC